MNAAARRWVSRELRVRFRSLAGLALIAVIAGGAILTAGIGAHRSLVVVDETMREHRQPDVMNFTDLPAPGWAPVVELPYVESYGLMAATALCLRETGGLRGPDTLCTQPPVAGGWYDSIWRIDILDGRRPQRPDEIAVNRKAVARFGWKIGQRLHVEGVAPGRLMDFWEEQPRGEQPWGPTFPVTVTGVFRGEDAWRVIGGGTGAPGFIMSTAFVPALGDRIEYLTHAFLRLRGGEADIRRLRTDIARLTGDTTFSIRNVREAQRRVERSTRIEAGALLLFAAAVLAAAAVLLGQAILRLIGASAADAGTLRSLGMAPLALTIALAAPALVVGVVGTLGAVAVAVAASSRMPIGLARSFDLHGGTKLDPIVVVPGALTMLAMITIGSLAAAAITVRRLARRRRPTRRRRVRSIARVPLPPTMALGLRMALQRQSGGESVPVRPGLIGAVVGVLAVVAALTLQQAARETLAEPARAGKAWDLAYLSDLDDRTLVEDPDVSSAERVDKTIMVLDGLPVPAYRIRAVGPRLAPTRVLEGRAPRGPREIALGPATAAALGVDIGDRLPAGPAGERPMRLVGLALLFEEGGHAAYDEGAWVARAALERHETPDPEWSLVLVDVRDGVDVAAVKQRHVAAGGVADDTRLKVPPAALDGLRRTRNVPLLLGGVLALLGVGAVAHTLITAVRRRRRDLAVLRALGLSRRQAGAVLVWDATVVATAAVVLGVPSGIAAGHLVWRWMADSMPVFHHAPSLSAELLLVIPATLLIINAVAAWPARSAARLGAADVLRTE